MSSRLISLSGYLPSCVRGQGTALSYVLFYFSTITLSHMVLCSKSTKSDIPKEKGKKAPRVWELGGCANKEVLDYSAPTTNGTPEAALSEDINLVRSIKIRAKVTVNQKELEGIPGFERRELYLEFLQGLRQCCQGMGFFSSAVSVPDPISFLCPCPPDSRNWAWGAASRPGLQQLR